MTVKYTIRPAQEQDIDSIAAIAKATDLFPADMLGEMISPFLSGEKSDKWFVARSEDHSVAFGFCEPERMTSGTWNLLAIGVTPSLQGKGIGAAMMDYIENALKEEGHRILLVETMGTPDFALTRNFYSKNHYTQEARIREFYEAGADKIIFWKKL